MATSIDTLTAELLVRLSTEEGRPPSTPGTHLVGGLVKAGAKLELVLRAVVIAVADADGVDPIALLASSGGRPPTLRKAMAGPLAHGLRAYVASRRGSPYAPELQAICDDLVRRDSRILGFIQVRNEVAKEGHEPRSAQTAMRQLRHLVSEVRRKAGWP